MPPRPRSMSAAPPGPADRDGAGIGQRGKLRPVRSHPGSNHVPSTNQLAPRDIHNPLGRPRAGPASAAPAATSSRTRCTSIGVDNTRRRPAGCAPDEIPAAAERDHRSPPTQTLSTRAPSQFAPRSAACHARNASAWPGQLDANSERSDLGSACTTVTGGRTGGTPSA